MSRVGVGGGGALWEGKEEIKKKEGEGGRGCLNTRSNLLPKRFGFQEPQLIIINLIQDDSATF